MEEATAAEELQDGHREHRVEQVRAARRVQLDVNEGDADWSAERDDIRGDA